MKAPDGPAVDIGTSAGIFAWKNQIKVPGTLGAIAFRRKEVTGEFK